MYIYDDIVVIRWTCIGIIRVQVSLYIIVLAHIGSYYTFFDSDRGHCSARYECISRRENPILSILPLAELSVVKTNFP